MNGRYPQDVGVVSVYGEAWMFSFMARSKMGDASACFFYARGSEKLVYWHEQTKGLVSSTGRMWNGSRRVGSTQELRRSICKIYCGEEKSMAS